MMGRPDGSKWFSMSALRNSCLSWANAAAWAVKFVGRKPCLELIEASFRKASLAGDEVENEMRQSNRKSSDVAE